MIDFKQKKGEIIIPVRVVPRASRNEISGEHGGALKVRITAPPVDGAANAELVVVLSKEFKVPKSSVEVVSGSTSRSKTIRISGLSDAAVIKLKHRLSG